ncbi:MAG: hypothetical protein JSW10_02825 [Pseudomonadota bacterium]|nr:MAG: hypothetical protein JSW10_02825 [Pseudomonadota bacterium]
MRKFIGPRYWPTWLGMGALWLTTRLPYPVMLALGHSLGWLGYYLLSSRRAVTLANIRLCFPELDTPAQQRLARRSFRSATLAIFESPLAWWGSDSKLKKLYRMEGLENADKVERLGKGVLVLGGHYTTLEIGGRFISYHWHPLNPTYKRAHNRLFETVLSASRHRVFGGLVRSTDIRDIVRKLKRGEIVWMAPDQDFGPRRSVFAPFMGVPTATLNVIARIAQLADVPTVPFYSERLPGTQGYLLRIGPMFENFPSGDEVADATRINQAIEEQVRRTPEQYLWAHRRFKTRPPGEPDVYPPRRDRSLRHYTRFMTLLALPALVYTAWLALRQRDARYLRQRAGIPGAAGGPVDVWVHAASVGEVNAVLPLILAIRAMHPDLTLALTTATPTGGEVARKRLPPEVRQHYLPLDWEHNVRRFLNWLQPGCALIVETELWPNLYEHLHNRAIPIFIVNGRISPRTLRAKGWLRHLLSRSIEYTSAILARSEEDRARFISMSPDPDKVEVIGNIKFASGEHAAVEPIDLGRRYVLAASTHDDEELRLARLWLRIAQDSHLLVIAPRHPHRAAKILKQLRTVAANVAVRSKGDAVTPLTQIYVADTFGELTQFIAGADLTVMGGSFAPVGGHNILEVAQFGKPVVFGPHMHNFEDEARRFVAEDAAVQVPDEAALGEYLERFLRAPDKALALGARARQLLESNSDVVERYLARLEALCPALKTGTGDQVES